MGFSPSPPQVQPSVYKVEGLDECDKVLVDVAQLTKACLVKSNISMLA